jgi:hypothetical protein
MPDLVTDIHALKPGEIKGVDDLDKPGHDDGVSRSSQAQR